MKAKIQTTAALLGAAGTFVIAAALLDRGEAIGGTPARDARGKEIAKPGPATPQACDAGAPRASARSGLATVNAGLSSAAIVRGGGGELHAAFEIATDSVAIAQRPPLNLALVIDRSGSMSGGRIENAQKAALGIVERLAATDRVALVQYDDQADVVLPSLAMSAAGKARMRAAIQGIALGGSTNLHGGLVLGRDEIQRTFQAQQVSRVILLSDGQANAGVVDPRAIAATARGAAEQGVRVTAVGLGVDFNEDLMESIAESGRGQYHYVRAASDLDRVIAGELSGIQATVATSVELHLTAPCGGAIVEVLGYESRRDGDTVIVPMADLSGGDRRKVLVKLSVPDRAIGKVGAVRGELVFKDASGGVLRRAAVSLGVDRTDDAQLAISAADKDVMGQVIELDAARAMRTAAEAYERGDAAAAVQALESSRAEIATKSQMYKVAPATSADVMDEMESMAASARSYDASSAEGKHLLKASKAKARAMSKTAR